MNMRTEKSDESLCGDDGRKKINEGRLRIKAKRYSKVNNNNR